MNNYKSVEETGKEIRKFKTGSVRDNEEGKGRWDLMPYEPLRRLAVHYENGAKKYGDRNWELGQEMSAYLRSAMRHLARFMDGENGEDHLSACVWNIFGFIHTEKNILDGKLPVSLIESLHPDIKKRIQDELSKRSLAGKDVRPKTFEGFKEGDQVIVKLNAKDYFRKEHSAGYSRYNMDRYNGQRGTINETYGNLLGVMFSDSNVYYYPPEALEEL